MSRFRALALASLIFLAGCVQRTPAPVTPPVAPKPTTAVQSGVVLSEPQPLDDVAAQRALESFRLSCPVLVKRNDATGLTKAGQWDVLCAEAAVVAPGGATTFFRDRFEWAQVGDGKAFATGYFEPEIAGSRVPVPGYAAPIYSLPPDLIRCTRADGSEGRGRLDTAGACVAYFTRAEIEDGALMGKGLEIAWAADHVALFFLEIQGSGRLRLPDGSVMRIGYAGQNGQAYVAIGKLLRERGALEPGKATMSAIVDWIAAHPDEGRALMRENASYVFFSELTSPGPLGALNIPVTPRASVAADPAFIPLGAPVFLAMDRAEANGLWVAQDTGGAIKGANRVDTFWGAGEEAKALAGGMAANGRALLLLPKGTVAGAQPRP